MDKHEFILRTSLVLNQPARTDADTSYFENKKHDVMLEELKQYLFNNADHLGAIDVKVLQALNDRGVDLLLTTVNNIKIGFQIKSHIDAQDNLFAANVKRQFTESFTYGLDKWYLMICCPILTNDKNFGPRIAHLTNEINAYKTDYHSVISPQSAVAIFLNNVKQDENNFQAKLNLYNYKQIDPVLKAKLELEYNQYGIGSIVANTSGQGKKNTTASAFITFLKANGYEFEDAELLSEISQFYAVLQSISYKDRQFYCSCIIVCYEKGAILNNSSSVYIPLSRLEDEGFTKPDIDQRVAKLVAAKLFRTDHDDDHEAQQRVAYLRPQTLIDELILPYHIKIFIKHNNILDKIISDLDFSLLD
jgi:hypothetical protein